MGRDLPLADVDLPVRKQFAQMIVGPAVAEPEFEHRPVEIRDQRGRQVEAGALRLEPADEAVEPAHAPDQAAMPACLAQTLDFGERGAQLVVGRIRADAPVPA